MWYIYDENDKKMSKGFESKKLAKIELMSSDQYDVNTYYRIGMEN